MINKIETKHEIEMKINNGRTMQLFQQEKDGNITMRTFDNKTGVVDCVINISSADMVMLINYYSYQKDNNLPIL